MNNRMKSLCFAGLIAVVALGAAHAYDDRDLLRSYTAPPNVLLIMDSGSTMVFDPETNATNYIDGGDNPASKLFQAKDAMKLFLDRYPDFNMGMTYYETDALGVPYLNYIYTVRAIRDDLGNDLSATFDGLGIGAEVRLGDKVDEHHNPDALPLWPIRYGRGGDEEFYMWDMGGYWDQMGPAKNLRPEPPSAGDRRLVSVILDSAGNRKVAGTAPFYYPAYNWAALPANIQSGMLGTTAWIDLAANDLGFDTTGLDDEEWVSEDWMFPTRTHVVDELEANKFNADNYNAGTWPGFDSVFTDAAGPEVLRVREQMEEYDGSAWVLQGDPVYVELEFSREFVLYDRPEGTPDDSQIAQAADNLTSCVWQGEGADCRGYMDMPEGDMEGDYNGWSNVPVVPLHLPESDGDTPDRRDWIRTLLTPQHTPFYYFPTQASGELYLPRTRHDFIPMTDTMIATGRRSIHVSLQEASKYLGDIQDWGEDNDPHYQCRLTFIIFVTDGLESCSSAIANMCAMAVDLGKMGIPIFTVGFGPEEAFMDGEELAEGFTCLSENSGGDVFVAEDKAALADAMTKIGGIIEERTRAFASPMVPSVEASTKQTAYLSTFTPYNSRSIWRGHLRAYPINPMTGVVGNLGTNGVPSVFSAQWDAGDRLATRWDWGDDLIDSAYGTSADPRKMYYGMEDGGVPTRKNFSYPGHLETAFEARQELGALLYGSWVDYFVDEFETERVDMRNTIDFIRGVRYGTDENGNQIPLRDVLVDEGTGATIWSSSYQWCGVTGDVGTGNADNTGTTCVEGQEVLGIEKLGDIFHSVPQRMSSPDCFACYLSDYQDYRGFLEQHRQRRTVMFAGANDGAMHAFDAGLWDPDGDDEGNDPQTDPGSGRELFAWVPTSVMPQFPELRSGLSHKYTVDGSGTVADVFIDKIFASDPDPDDREWRTLLMWGQRRGGRSYVALDITQPDTYTYDSGSGEYVTDRPGMIAFKTNEEQIGDADDIDPEIYLWDSLDSSVLAPDTGRDALCADGTASGCSGEWPALRWEFTDLSDEESGSGDPDNPDPGEGEADLGQTWSQPLIGFVHVTVDESPQDRMVAFFGGGLSPAGLSATNGSISGNWIYGLDMETGEILLKLQVDGMAPGGVQGLDLDLDGFLEKLYFATTSGAVYRIDFSTAGVVDGTSGRVTSWTADKIFAAIGDQPFFMRPTLVPITFNADGSAVLAIAIGAGNRDDIFEENDVPHRFYLFMEPTGSPVTALTDTDLQGLTLNSDNEQTENFLVSTDVDGWYLELFDVGDDEGRNFEKVNTNALVLNEYVIFSTFEPSEVDVLDNNICERSGSARTYVVSLYNANPEPGEERYEDHEGDTAIVSDPVVYVGADGKIHVVQASDDLELEEPIASFAAPVRMVNWKEN